MTNVHFMIPWPRMTEFTKWLYALKGNWTFDVIGESDKVMTTEERDLFVGKALKSRDSSVIANLPVRLERENDVMLARISWEVSHIGECTKLSCYK